MNFLFQHCCNWQLEARRDEQWLNTIIFQYERIIAILEEHRSLLKAVEREIDESKECAGAESNFI